VVNLVCIGKKSAYRNLTRKHIERDHLKYLGVDGTIVLKQLLQQTEL